LEEVVSDEGYVESASHGGSEDGGCESYASFLGDDDGVDSGGFCGSEYGAEVHGVVELVEEDECDVSCVLGEYCLECGWFGGLDEGDDSLVVSGLGEGVEALLGDEFYCGALLLGEAYDLCYLGLFFGSFCDEDLLWLCGFECFVDGVASFYLDHGWFLGRGWVQGLLWVSDRGGGGLCVLFFIFGGRVGFGLVWGVVWVFGGVFCLLWGLVCYCLATG